MSEKRKVLLIVVSIITALAFVIVLGFALRFVINYSIVRFFERFFGVSVLRQVALEHNLHFV